MNLMLICLSFLMLSVSANSATFSTKKGGNCYNLDIPDYMTRTYQLNDVASLQYQNVNKEAYCIVIDDSKEQLEAAGIKFVNPTEFLDSFVSSYMTEAENRKVSASSEYQANGNKHSQTELTWKSEENDFYMLITVVETNNSYYKILCWTLAKFKDTLKPDFVKISKSLKD